ncbi:MAG: S8 family peptidase [candidate division WOR-3 bacterium]
MYELVHLLLIFTTPVFVRTQEKTAPPSIKTNKVWVFFTDKGIYTQEQYQAAVAQLEQSATAVQWQRRQNEQINGYDFDDLPVREDYVRQIEAMGARLRTVSNWLNAASFDMPPEMVPRVYWLPFVYSITPVATRSETELDMTVPIKQPQAARTLRKVDSADAHRFYGAAWDQAQMLGVPEIFFQGWFGSGVRLALFDTGLKLKHTAVKNLRIIKQYDFISGDNFYIAQGNSTPEPINTLRYLGLVKDPVLSLNGNNAILAFVADSFNYTYNLPVRAVFYSFSTDRGANWSSAIPITISRPYYYTYENLCMRVKDSVTYLAFTEIDLHQGASPTCHLGYLINTQWANRLTIGTGKQPSLATFLDTLYLAYLKNDSAIVFRKAVINLPEPNWLLFTEINLTETITAPQITAGPDREVNIYACAKNSGRIIHLQSDDGGENFTPQADIVSNGAHMPKLFSHTPADSIKFLIYQDKSQLPFTRLKIARSFDWGRNWDAGYTIDSALTIGNYTLSLNSKITIIYESAGILHQLTSTDLGRTWQDNGIIDTTGFSYSPNLSPDNSFCLWFKRGDDNVLWEESDSLKFSPEQPNHGTRMASIIAGYQPYSLMGIAPGVDLIVAKTEFYKTSSSRAYEYNMEEDTYIQALEWAERCGADVVSTSLGYRGWYRDEEFDGRTAPISIACDLAAKRGMLIVTAMGNRDTTVYPWPKPYIVAPGDAEGVITCGGVERNLLPWRGTGTGPTADGRIKPDLVALSDTVAVVAPDSVNFLEGSVGTSCATALIAGCCALLKEAHPNWSAESIKAALFSTATLSVKSCTFGFGVPRVDSAFKLYHPVSHPLLRDQIALIYPNPFILGEHETLYFAINFHRPTPQASITIYTVSGIKIKTIELNTIGLAIGKYKDKETLVKMGAFWDGRNENNKPVSSGLYLAVLNTTFGKSVAKFALVRKD